MAGKTDTPAKKYRSKWTRIAVEGATTDGRNIERSWIEDMASTYSPDTYGARINCEHIKGYWPGGEFGAYGDVLALKAEEVEIAGVKKLALFGQLEPNAALLALNKAGQKVYTSIEVQPKFADSGKAYLVGLAITDSPASLGTEALSFSTQHGTLANRKRTRTTCSLRRKKRPGIRRVRRYPRHVRLSEREGWRAPRHEQGQRRQGCRQFRRLRRVDRKPGHPWQRTGRRLCC